MTPQERQLVTDLFGRLASLENNPRDADAQRAIQEGMRTAPNAVYALVQTVLVQDEALKRADARIQELEGSAQPTQGGGGFLDQMREAFTGRSSVPNSGSRWGNPNINAAPQAQAPGERGGGSFLGTAAAAAAGVIGGSLLMNSIGSMFGHRGQAFAGEDASRGGQNPWGNESGGDLSREAGLNDIGGGNGGSERAGFFDDSDAGNDDGDFDVSDSGGDFGGGDSA
jgi:hypothetical protein